MIIKCKRYYLLASLSSHEEIIYELKMLKIIYGDELKYLMAIKDIHYMFSFMCFLGDKNR